MHHCTSIHCCKKMPSMFKRSFKDKNHLTKVSNLRIGGTESVKTSGDGKYHLLSVSGITA